VLWLCVWLCGYIAYESLIEYFNLKLFVFVSLLWG
jgi:hypothetical protein